VNSLTTMNVDLLERNSLVSRCFGLVQIPKMLLFAACPILFQLIRAFPGFLRSFWKR
jgi:hypothetical protein